MVKVKIDDKECTQCGLCYNDNCPEVFAEGGDGTSELLPAFQKGDKFSGEIPADKQDCAKRAAEDCPVTAITVG